MAKVQTTKKGSSKSPRRRYSRGRAAGKTLVAESPSQYQLRLSLDEHLSPSQVDKRIDVEERLVSLLSRDLTFKGEKTNYASHNLHAFAAKFPPQLPRLFIRELTRPGEVVLDPMVGSGTAIVEAVLAGRHAIGVDLDPLAVLIAQVKSMRLNLARCVHLGSRLLQETKKSLSSGGSKELSCYYSPQALEFFKYWFKPHTVAELQALIQAINRIREPAIRSFFRVVFSSTIITKSGGVTRARDLAHSRPHRDENKQIPRSALDAFRLRLHKAIVSMENLVETSAHAHVVRGDARSLPLRDDSVQLIVTSPPYAANAIDYVRAHKFSLIWFGYEPKSLSELRRNYIGAEVRSQNLGFASETANRVLNTLQREDGSRAAVVAHYFSEMDTTLSEMLRVLSPGRAAILVVGSSIIRGVHIKAPKVLAELAESAGFYVKGMANRQIVRDARMLPVSCTTSRNGIEARMHEEGVIGLIKPNKKEAYANA
jgi:DNA modification methylase